jgi:hypothetical protein
MPDATGTFDVKLVALPVENIADDALIHRRSIDKTFHGALTGTSQGQMLSSGTTTEGSAVYVAVERVTGTLDGRAGTFALYHTGVMERGAPALSVTIVPDSGTGELAGIKGTLSIDPMDKRHYYTLHYEL